MCITAGRLELQHAQRSNDLAQTKRSRQRVEQAQMAVEAAASTVASVQEPQVTEFITCRRRVTL